MCLCVDLGYPWRTANRPPGTFGNAPLLVIRKDKVYSLVGRAEAHSVFVIHDGSKDYFTSAPPCVRVLFESTAEIREFTRFDVSSKLFAIILEQLKTKGPLNYEMSAMKLRNGFGKGIIKLVSPRGTTAKQVEKLFRGKATVQATSSTNIHETPASTHQHLHQPHHQQHHMRLKLRLRQHNGHQYQIQSQHQLNMSINSLGYNTVTTLNRVRSTDPTIATTMTTMTP